MEINCEFFVGDVNSEILYSCKIEEAFITAKDQVIKEFKGFHEEGKSHFDVKCVYFYITNVNHFPQGLHKHFPNLTYLVIHGGGIKKISKSDLRGLEGLVRLWIEKCELTSLPDDLFSKMPNLREISFFGNQIEFASSELLKPLIGRRNLIVSLQENKSIDAHYWLGEEGSLWSLDELMDLIDEKCLKPSLPIIVDPVNFNPKLKEMWVTGRFSDLTIVADEKEFKVHKTVLGMQSEVFAQIFEDQSEATEIKISDFSPDSVEALLKFIYTNEISEDGNAKEIFEIADKFKVAAMKINYEKMVCNQVSESNAWEFFLFAHRFSSQELKEKSFRLIVKNIPDEVTDELMEDPEELKKLLDYRRSYEEVLEKWKKWNFA